MGCVVNGIGESGNADIGIAGGDGCAVIFSHGEKLRKVSEEEALPGASGGNRKTLKGYTINEYIHH